MQAQTANNAWFARLTQIDPDFDDPNVCNAMNKMAREVCMNFHDEQNYDPALLGFHQISIFATRCIEQMFISGKKTIEVREQPRLAYDRLMDERNL